MAKKFTIPTGTQPRFCKGCRAVIYWLETGNGKRLPIDADGTTHWASCPAANQFRPNENPHGFKEGDEALTAAGELITIAQCGHRHCYDSLDRPHRLSELRPFLGEDAPPVARKTYEQLSLLEGGADA